MSDPELALFQQQLGNARVYLEFGSGGSTLVACQSKAERIFSVESSGAWIDKCKENPVIAEAVQVGRLTFHHADFGEVGPFGSPTPRSDPARFADYYLSVWKEIGEQLPDLVLVDGRWRVQCAVQALLRCGPQVHIMIHDFGRRPQYRPIKRFSQKVERQDSLVVLAPKPDLDYRSLALFGFKYLFDSR